MPKAFTPTHRRKAAAHKLSTKQNSVPTDSDLDAIGAGISDEDMESLLGEMGDTGFSTGNQEGEPSTSV